MGAVISRKSLQLNINADRLGPEKPAKGLKSQYTGRTITTAKPDEAKPKPGNAPVFGPEAIELGLDLKAQREVAYALCFASRFADGLYKAVAHLGIPLDEPWLNQFPAPRRDGLPSIPLINVLEFTVLLTCYAREALLLKARRPDLFPASEGDEDEGNELRVYGIISERDVRADYRAAAAHGLSVVPRRIRARATMPGCWGLDPEGSPCKLLRRPGDELCPKHMREERQKMKSLEQQRNSAGA
jgi:hypothetical protein